MYEQLVLIFSMPMGPFMLFILAVLVAAHLHLPVVLTHYLLAMGMLTLLLLAIASVRGLALGRKNDKP